MKPSTSVGTTSNVGMAKPAPSVRLAGNIHYLLVIYWGSRSSVTSMFDKVNSRRRCRARGVAAPGKFEAQRLAATAQKRLLKLLTWSTVLPRTLRILLGHLWDVRITEYSRWLARGDFTTR